MLARTAECEGLTSNPRAAIPCWIARSPARWEILRRRLVAHGACEGKVSDFGSLVSVWFTDPDGMELEVACIRQGADIADAVDPQPEGAGMSA